MSDQTPTQIADRLRRIYLDRHSVDPAEDLAERQAQRRADFERRERKRRQRRGEAGR
jgi:hypothetical protein